MGMIQSKMKDKSIKLGVWEISDFQKWRWKNSNKLNGNNKIWDFLKVSKHKLYREFKVNYDKFL